MPYGMTQNRSHAGVDLQANRFYSGGNIVLPGFAGPGVNIGDGTVIGAGSIVVRDVPAGVLAAGNPCRIIRELAGS